MHHSAQINDRLAGMARSKFAPSLLRFVTALPGIVSAVVNDRLSEQSPKMHVILSEAAQSAAESKNLRITVVLSGVSVRRSVCGARQPLRLSEQACVLPTAAHAYVPLHPPPAARANAAFDSLRSLRMTQ